MNAPGTSQHPVSASGWNARLYWQWILYNSAAFVVVLTFSWVLVLVGSDVLHLGFSSHHTVWALVVGILGAVLFGGVLGVLQWLVVRQRVPVPRRKWVIANIGPALLGWLLVIMPAVINAENSHNSVSTAYLLAASQTLALGPLLGVSQALVLRKVTRRWAWWIGANVLSWLIANAAIYLLSHVFGGLNVFSGHGSIAEVYLTLIATTPLTGRTLLWVLAAPALTVPAQPQPSAGGQAPQARPA